MRAIKNQCAQYIILMHIASLKNLFQFEDSTQLGKLKLNKIFGVLGKDSIIIHINWQDSKYGKRIKIFKSFVVKAGKMVIPDRDTDVGKWKIWEKHCKIYRGFENFGIFDDNTLIIR